MHKALADDSDPHKVRGMYIMGENPAMSDPDLNHARHALGSLSHLVVQDIFLTAPTVEFLVQRGVPVLVGGDAGKSSSPPTCSTPPRSTAWWSTVCP